MKIPLLLKTPLSVVNNVQRVETYTRTLGDVFEIIRGQKYASVIEEIRTHQAMGETVKAKQFKKTLPSILFAGTFSKRNNKSLTRHSGLLVLDFDDCNISLKAVLAKDPHAVLCFTSPRGNGLKLIVRVDPASNQEEHGQSFDAAREYFSKKYSIDADKSGRDIARLCFISHDPEAILCPESEVLHRQRRPQRQCRPQMTINENGDSTGKGEIKGTYSKEEIIEMTQPSKPGQRHRKVFDLARGLKYECGLAGNEPADLKPIVRQWFGMAKPYIETQEFDETWSDFVHAWPRANNPLSDSALEDAWDMVLAGDFPFIAQEYDSQQVQQLVGLCWHLKDSVNQFYLSTHTAGELLGVKPMQTLRWLRMLQADGIIELVIKGDRRKASTYRWITLSA
jgi:hypothetical protein